MKILWFFLSLLHVSTDFLTAYVLSLCHSHKKGGENDVQKTKQEKKKLKKIFKALHIIVITLKYAFKILKELKAIIDLFNK